MLPIFCAAALGKVPWVHCAPAYGKCGGDGWNGAGCCVGNVCEEKDEFYSQCIPAPKVTGGGGGVGADARRPVVTSVDLASSGLWSGLLEASRLELSAVPWSRAVSVGLLDVSHAHEPSVQVVRNPGGGTSKCCSMHKVAAAARSNGPALQVQLEPRSNGQVSAWDSRNGARVYLASLAPGGGALSKRISDVEYVGWDLIGKTLEFTIDLSNAECGCNAAVVRGSPCLRACCYYMCHCACHACC